MAIVEIQKSEAYDKHIRFKDVLSTPCRVGVDQDGLLRLAIYGPISSNVFFSQEDIKSLLPYLQAFASNGQLLLQGDLAEAFEPENMVKVSAEQERLIKTWRSFADDLIYMLEPSCMDENPEYRALCGETSKLLGEEK